MSQYKVLPPKIDMPAELGVNETKELREFPIAALFGGYLALSIAGILINSFIIVASRSKSVAHGNYKAFTLNLAVMDLLSSLTNFGYAFVFLNLNYRGVFCKLFAFLSQYAPLAVLFALLPISLNRYAVVCREELASLFTARANALLCLLCDLAPALIFLPFGTFVSRFGRAPDKRQLLCLVEVSQTRFSAMFVFFLSTSVTLLVNCLISGLVLTLNVATQRHIRRLRVASANSAHSDALERRLHESAQVARATLAQVTPPIVKQLATFALYLAMYLRLHQRLDMADAPLYGMIAFTSNPLVDGLVTVCVLRPYNSFARRSFRRLIGVGSSLAAAVSASGEPQIVGLAQLRPSPPVAIAAGSVVPAVDDDRPAGAARMLSRRPVRPSASDAKRHHVRVALHRPPQALPTITADSRL